MHYISDQQLRLLQKAKSLKLSMFMHDTKALQVIQQNKVSQAMTPYLLGSGG